MVKRVVVEPAGPQTALETSAGIRAALPLFVPVFNPASSMLDISLWTSRLSIEGCILNSFFLYKNRPLRERFKAGLQVKAHIGFDRLVMTDSGAFQGFTRQLYLNNKEIVRFQDMIGSDIVSPIDLVTPPGDNFELARQKLNRTHLRIAEARACCTRGSLAGVQQGGRHKSLRTESSEWLARGNFEFVALGSLVPFFNQRHDMAFVCHVIREARAILGPTPIIHVYGAGDPLEIPFFFASGADMVDSSSYAHYAQRGSYMTPYGAFTDARKAAAVHPCACSCCTELGSVESVLADEPALQLHNLQTILATVRRVREELKLCTLDRYLNEVLTVHAAHFPDSLLPASWNSLHGG